MTDSKAWLERLLMSVENKFLVRGAFDFAAAHHAGQIRKDGSPYILHPLRVACELAEWNMDETTVISGLLHDLIEDTDVEPAVLENQFGGDIALIVKALTKIKEIPAVSKDVENLRQLIIAMSRDVRVIIVRLADKLDNIRTIEWLSTDQQKKFAGGIIDIYAPLAHRIGMNIVKNEMEDIAFKIENPEEYKKIKKFLDKMYPRALQTMETAEKELASKLKGLGVSLVKIASRIKSPLSIYRKEIMQNKNLDELEDIFAMRIITADLEGCYKTLAVLHNFYKPVEGSFTDYITYPKINMYQSIHTTCRTPAGEFIEFQIRTHDMDRTAEFGIAAHWKYKNIDGRAAKGLKEWLLSFYEWQMENISKEEFLRNLRTQLSYDEIFVLTPKSDVKRLIKGATPLDFAYSIHSDIGDHFRGCLVNGKMVAKDHVLQSGDKVRILTLPGSHPTRDWLKFARSPRARYKIRRGLKENSRKQPHPKKK